MNTLQAIEAARAMTKLYWVCAEKGMTHAAAQEFAVSETCEMMGVNRAALEAAIAEMAS